MDDDKSDDIDASFSCVDCGQEFGSREQLEEHETKHQNLLRTDSRRWIYVREFESPQDELYFLSLHMHSRYLFVVQYIQPLLGTDIIANPIIFFGFFNLAILVYLSIAINTIFYLYEYAF
jgi:hypothetical protein